MDAKLPQATSSTSPTDASSTTTPAKPSANNTVSQPRTTIGRIHFSPRYVDGPQEEWIEFVHYKRYLRRRRRRIIARSGTYLRRLTYFTLTIAWFALIGFVFFSTPGGDREPKYFDDVPAQVLGQ